MSRSRKGIALVTTVLMLPIMVLLGFCLTAMGVHNLGLSEATEHTKQSEDAAEAGANYAFEQLKTNSAASGTFTYSMHTLTDAANGTIVNNAAGGASVTAPNGAIVPAGFAYILSQCQTPDKRVTRSTGVLVKLSAPSLFDAAIASNTTITMSGNGHTDAYNSTLGPYNGALGGGKYNENTVNGGIATDSTAASAVTLSGNADVGGSISVGSGGNPSTVITGGTKGVNYVSASASGGPSISAVVVPAALTAGGYTTNYTSGTAILQPGYYGDVQVSGQNTLTLATAGTYVFDSLSLSGQAQFITPAVGKVTVYITDKTGKGLDLSGGSTMNQSGIPGNLLFYIAGKGDVAISGNGEPFFGIYAPLSKIAISGNGDIYGSIVGDSIDDSGNGTVHYDQAMATPVNGAPPQVVNWQRF